MSSKIWWVLAASLTVVSGLCGLNVSQAEDPAAVQPRFKGTSPAKIIRAHQFPDEARQKDDLQSKSNLIELVARLRYAENDEEKAQAKAELAAMIPKYFDEDMKQRTEEVSQLEERIKKLRSLLERRASKRQEIIELQLKVIESEADGMGFIGMPQPGMGMPAPLPMSGSGPFGLPR